MKLFQIVRCVTEPVAARVEVVDAEHWVLSPYKQKVARRVQSHCAHRRRVRELMRGNLTLVRDVKDAHSAVAGAGEETRRKRMEKKRIHLVVRRVDVAVSDARRLARLGTHRREHAYRAVRAAGCDPLPVCGERRRTAWPAVLCRGFESARRQPL
eukprot:Amastigsp_a510587_15.p2 type:complete len:155 gc:universal Amastigsp_a510587_15:803-339(-)